MSEPGTSQDRSAGGPSGAATLVLRGHVLQVGLDAGAERFTPPDGPRVATWTVVVADPAAGRAVLAGSGPDLAAGAGTLVVGDPWRTVGALRTASFDGVLVHLPEVRVDSTGAELLDELFRVVRNGGLLGWSAPDGAETTGWLRRMRAAGFRPVAFSGTPTAGPAANGSGPAAPVVLVATKSADGFGLRFSATGDVVMGPR